MSQPRVKVDIITPGLTVTIEAAVALGTAKATALELYREVKSATPPARLEGGGLGFVIERDPEGGGCG